MRAPIGWSHLADLKKAIRPTDLWKKHFAAWAPAAADGAQQAAAGCFGPIAEGFASERKLTLQAEQEAQQQWLAKRAEEITGRADGEVQLGLLDRPSKSPRLPGEVG